MTRAYSAAAIAIGLLLSVALLYIWKNGLAGAARGTVNAANNLVGGTVVGLGDVLGIPATNMTECEQLLAAGHYWDASFKCPAGTLIKGFFGDTPASGIPGAASSPALPASTGTAAPGIYSPAPDLSFAAF